MPEQSSPGHGTEAYIERVTARPAFQKAHSDQITHFATADKERSGGG
jgi:glutathione S-transferase